MRQDKTKNKIHGAKGTYVIGNRKKPITTTDKNSKGLRYVYTSRETKRE